MSSASYSPSTNPGRCEQCHRSHLRCDWAQKPVGISCTNCQRKGPDCRQRDLAHSLRPGPGEYIWRNATNVTPYHDHDQDFNFTTISFWYERVHYFDLVCKKFLSGRVTVVYWRGTGCSDTDPSRIWTVDEWITQNPLMLQHQHPWDIVAEPDVWNIISRCVPQGSRWAQP